MDLFSLSHAGQSLFVTVALVVTIAVVGIVERMSSPKS
jgi:hypothetical protein